MRYTPDGISSAGGSKSGIRPSVLVFPTATVSQTSALPGALRSSRTATYGAGLPRQVSRTWVVMGERTEEGSASLIEKTLRYIICRKEKEIS